MEIKLSRNGWHRKLQEYVFWNPPMYYNFCPYFWLTNFCILVTFIIPVVPLIKGLIWCAHGIERAMQALADFVDAHYCQPNFDKKVKNMSNDDILQSWVLENDYSTIQEGEELSFWRHNVYENSISSMKYRNKEALVKKFTSWKKKHPDWQELIIKIKAHRVMDRDKFLKMQAEDREKQRLYEEKRIERAERAKKRKQEMFSFIAKNTKWVMFVLAGAVLLFVGYWVYRLIIHIIEHFHYPNFIYVIKVIGLTLLVLGIGGTLIFFIAKIVSKIECNVCIGENRVFNAIGRFFK